MIVLLVLVNEVLVFITINLCDIINAVMYF